MPEMSVKGKNEFSVKPLSNEDVDFFDKVAGIMDEVSVELSSHRVDVAKSLLSNFLPPMIVNQFINAAYFGVRGSTLSFEEISEGEIQFNYINIPKV